MGYMRDGDDGTLNFCRFIKSRSCGESELLDFQTNDIEANGISEDLLAYTTAGFAKNSDAASKTVRQKLAPLPTSNSHAIVGYEVARQA
jgi:hypothetical protein